MAGTNLYPMNNFINTTGYTKGSKTEENPFNIIPSNNITMKKVDQPLYAIPYYNGQPGEMILMESGKNYDFSGADYVMEIPAKDKMQFGGYIGTTQYGNNGNTWYNGNNPYFSTSPGGAGQQNPQTWDTWAGSPEGQSWQNTPSPSVNQSTGMYPVNEPTYNPQIQSGLPYSAPAPNIPQNNQMVGAETPTQGSSQNILNFSQWQNQGSGQMFNPYATNSPDMESSGFRFGESIGQKNGLGAALAGSQVMLGMSRNILSGLATGKASREAYDEYRKKQFSENNNYNQVLKNGGMIHPIPKRPMQNGGTIEDFKNAERADLNTFNSVPQYQGDVIRHEQYPYTSMPSVPSTNPYANVTIPNIYPNAVMPKSYKVSERHHGSDYSTDYVVSDPANIGTDQNRSQVVTPIYQKGGEVTNAHALTGEYVLPAVNTTPSTVEMEKNEVIKNPDQSVQTVAGEKHKDGGTDVNAEDGTQVISDFLKIGGNNARHFRKEYDIDVKATDTYAKVIDKYSKKIGLKKTIDEEAELLTEVETQLQKEESDTTRLNLDFLSGKLTEISEKKIPLEEMRKLAFDDVFNRQEKVDKKEDTDNNEMQMGGIATKYGVSLDKAKELVAKHRGTMQTGGTVPFFTPSQYAQPDYQNQPFVEGLSTVSGSIGDYDGLVARMKAQQQYLPNVVNNSGILDAEGKVALNNIQAFQKNYNDYGTAANIASEINPYLTPEQKAAYAKTVQDEIFTEQGVRGFDGIYGDFTSSRGAFTLPYFKPSDRAQFPDVKRVGDLITPEGTIKPEYATLDPETQAAILKVAESGSTAYDIGVGDIPVPAQSDLPETLPQAEADVARTEFNGAGLNIPQLPGRYIMPPSPFQVPYKGDVSLSRIDPVKVSIEPSLVEAERQRIAATDNLGFLPDSQRAAAVSQILGQTQGVTNQAISQAEQVNAQAQNQANIYNAQITDKESLLDLENALSYEGRVFGGMNAYERDLRGYYNAMNDQNAENFRYVRDTNLLNQRFDNFKTDGSNVIFADDGTRLSVGGANTTLTPQQKAALVKQYSKQLKNGTA